MRIRRPQRGRAPGPWLGLVKRERQAVPVAFPRLTIICHVDEEGRPMVFHRRRLVFFLPEAPPEVNDRTFIETDECQ